MATIFLRMKCPNAARRAASVAEHLSPYLGIDSVVDHNRHQVLGRSTT